MKSRSVNPQPHKEMNAVYLGGRVSVSPQSLLESHNCITITNEHIMQNIFQARLLNFQYLRPRMCIQNVVRTHTFYNSDQKYTTLGMEVAGGNQIPENIEHFSIL